MKLPPFFKYNIPTRFYIGVMLFTACWVSYMMRVNMSINILEMVQVKPSSSNKSESECISVLPLNTSNDHVHVAIEHVETIDKNAAKYNWTVGQQGLILGMYFWGYLSTSLAGGWMAEAWGAKIVVGTTVALSGLVTLLHPAAASLGYEALLACRFIIGALGGVLYPCLHYLVANWAPPEEKGKFIGALLGGTFGTVITWSLCGVLISSLGWEWAFYVPGIITLVWCIMWFVIVSDRPEENSWIDAKEKKFISDCIGNTVAKKKSMPPFKSILMSVPFWAFVVLHYGNLWGLYFLLTAGPKFVAQVLGFDISKVGLIAGLPYISRMLMGFVFGSIGDILRKKKTFSVTAVRKSFIVFSHLIPGLLLVLLTFIGCNQVLSIAIITASLGFNGAATVTNLQNHQDLAPNYVGTLYGIANFIGTSTGFITPIITAHFTKEHNGLEEWRWIFFIGAAAYFLAGIFFIIFGTGETQSWNMKSDDDSVNDAKENSHKTESTTSNIT